MDPRVGGVLTTDSATEALRILHDLEVDAVFLDIQMPGLTGLELAKVFSRFKAPPPIVFVTAHEEHAVEAFDLRAVDYVLKPVRAERLSEAVRRIVDSGAGGAQSGDEQIPVERGGVTRFVNRSDITHVEAQGDYARLHTAGGSHLIRTPLSTLEEEWGPAGFVRIHRSLLVSLNHIDEVRIQSPVLLVPTCCGAVMPLAVQLSVLRSASISVARLSLPPRATDFSTNSRAADHEKTPKKVGEAPGLACWSQLR